MNTIKVGVAVIIKKDNKVLLGKRLSKHGQATWGFPGGHLEFNETVEACAQREVLEETGLLLTNFSQGPFTDDIFDSKKQYITLFMITDLKSGEPQVMEPTKCEQWQWFRWNELPNPLFLPIKNLLQTTFNPFS